MTAQSSDMQVRLHTFGSIACLAILLLCASSSAIFAAVVQPSRSLYVGGGFSGGDGLSADRPLGSINAALQKARKGDVIIVTPGEYRESIVVSTAGITILGSAPGDGEPRVVIDSPAGKTTKLLTDSADTVWRGIAFRLRGSGAVTLRAFTGRFEYCRFTSESPVPGIEVYGGNPVFQGCTFTGGAGPAAQMALNGQTGRSSRVTMAYCLFRDAPGGAVLLRGEQDVRFVNCLFAACRFITMRQSGVGAQVSATNSVFFLNAEPSLFLQSASAPKVRINNCLYAPAPGTFMIWQARPLEKQPEITAVDSIMASPRFEGGRNALLNLCVDDTVNAPVWRSLTPAAAKLGLKITLALNTDALSPQYWKMIIPEVNAGFEVASHGAVHSSITSAEVMRVGWFDPAGTSASLSIDQAEQLRVVVGGKELCVIDLVQQPYLSMGALVRQLQEKGLRAELVSLSHEKIPAYLLAPVQEQDIFFAQHNAELVMDTKAYMHYMLSESRRKIEQGLREYHAAQKSCIAFVCPYSESNANIRQAMQATGFIISRSHMVLNFPSAEDIVDLSAIQSISLKDIEPSSPTPNLKEMLRMYLDYLKYHGSIMGLYSHGANEWTANQWIDLFEVLDENRSVKTAGLAEIAATVKEQCESTGPWTYRCPSQSGPVGGETSFRPGQDSPLIGAGVPTEFNTDYAGRPLQAGQRPNIGLY